MYISLKSQIFWSKTIYNKPSIILLKSFAIFGVLGTIETKLTKELELIHCKFLSLVIIFFCVFFVSCNTPPVDRPRPYENVIQLRPMEEEKIDKIKIIPRSEWTNEGPVIFDLDPMTNIHRITIHHTAMPDDDTQYSGSAILKVQKILYLHKHQRNWADIGYHYIIDQSGRIWEGRNIKYQGAHAQGKNNIGNIGVVLIGNFELYRPNEAQKKSLFEFVDYLQKKYNIKNNNIFAHEHFTGTKCPGKHMMNYVEQLRKGVK